MRRNERMMGVNFEEFWRKVCVVTELPNTAQTQIPAALSEKTKKKLMRMTPAMAGNAINSAIDEINKGSVKGIDELLGKMK